MCAIDKTHSTNVSWWMALIRTDSAFSPIPSIDSNSSAARNSIKDALRSTLSISLSKIDKNILFFRTRSLVPSNDLISWSASKCLKAAVEIFWVSSGASRRSAAPIRYNMTSGGALEVKASNVSDPKARKFWSKGSTASGTPNAKHFFTSRQMAGMLLKPFCPKRWTAVVR